MKKHLIRLLNISLILSILFTFTFSTSAFAISDIENSQIDPSYLKLDLSTLNPGDTISYGIAVYNDGTVKSIPFNDEIEELLVENSIAELYVFNMTMVAWVGSSVTFILNVRSLGGAMSYCNGTVEIYKTSSLGIQGALYNSMTFRLRDGMGTTYLSDEYSMNAGSLSDIYLKASNVTVTDTFGETLSLGSSQKRFKKSNF